MSSTIRVVTCNTLFGGHTDFGFGPADRWDGQVEFLRTLRPDILALQECNFWDQLGGRRLHRMVNEVGLAQGILAEANPTTAGHRFHSAILLSEHIRVHAAGSDRTRYHHVMGWAHLILPGAEQLLEVRNLHLDPFDPRNRAREVAPLEVLAAPDRLSLLLGDINSIGAGFGEPDWSRLPAHLLNGHLRSPGNGLQSDREAVELLARAGFIDASISAGKEKVPTAAFADGDVPRRQDLILASPALAPAVTGYQVHMEPVDKGLSDHAAVSIDLDLNRIIQS
ncbi:endonuclease/exonuclease/phosphatase family protein [Streptomyces sp. NPDC059604]|uniref:endonuclease/exonuclease/phosphatase family protein n=1 Tax=Streptomyces sp. NPDC059604 TaxID=3346881 RepID=UPI00369E3D43